LLQLGANGFKRIRPGGLTGFDWSYIWAAQQHRPYRLLYIGGLARPMYKKRPSGAARVADAARGPVLLFKPAGFAFPARKLQYFKERGIKSPPWAQ
jgi:hypothetical protein